MVRPDRAATERMAEVLMDVEVPGYRPPMTTTPNEPVTDPDVVPSGDPEPIDPGEPGVPDEPQPDPTS